MKSVISMFVVGLMLCICCRSEGEREKGLSELPELEKHIKYSGQPDSAIGLASEIDTLDLIFQHFNCDCPNWFDVDEKRRIEDSLSNANSSTGLWYSLVDQAQFAYYIEPISEEVNFDLSPWSSGSIVRFIGRKYIEKTLPALDFTTGHPPLGNVFRFHGYKFIEIKQNK